MEQRQSDAWEVRGTELKKKSCHDSAKIDKVENQMTK